MADIVFNIAKGRVNEFVKRVDANDPSTAELVMILLKVVEADATLKDYDDFATLIAAAGNTRCDFTNYADRVLTDADITAPTPDDTNDDQEAAVSDWVIAAAGGATNNSIVKLVICYDGPGTGVDANLVPLTAHDLTVTTDGTQLTIAPSATSFFRAA